MFLLFFNATGLLKNWKKQHFICINLTLFIVPFFLFTLFFSFFLFFLFFSFFLSFFLFFFFLGGGRATASQPFSNDASASDAIISNQTIDYYIGMYSMGDNSNSIQMANRRQKLPKNAAKNLGLQFAYNSRPT